MGREPGYIGPMKDGRDHGDTPVAPHPPLASYYREQDERRRFVRSLFDRGARHYTWINRVMSLGTGFRYRREALQRAGLAPGMRVLDVCVGTGQVTEAALSVVGESGWVAALDVSMGMLVHARRRLGVDLVEGRVEELPVRDGSVDFVTMGYALRHVADLRQTFREYHRVLRPGGTVLIIEFARPSSRVGYHAIRLYLRTVVPLIARIGGREAQTMMRYFWDTIDSCVPPATILELLAEAGFQEPRKGGQIELLAEYSGRA